LYQTASVVLVDLATLRGVVDAFGRMLLDGADPEIVERDDGFISTSMLNYFAPARRWAAVERRALRFVRGRVLDVGVGAGRVALELQARGREVVAIDVSPGAVELARTRGVRDVRLLGLEDVVASLGRFDTVVMYGNNFGLFGSPAKAGRLLGRLRPFVERIVATSNDPYGTEDPAHLAYQERNRARGRMSGELRLRVRYRDLVGPWFAYLIVSPQELAEVVEGTGWQISRLVRDEGSYYVAVLE
jgi:SAM-dependent methyltransferase